MQATVCVSVCVCVYPLCCMYIMPKWTNEEMKKKLFTLQRALHTLNEKYCAPVSIQDFKTRLKERLHFVRHHVCLCVYVKRQEEVNAFRWGYAIMPSAICAGVWMWKGAHIWLNATEFIFAYACICQEFVYSFMYKCVDALIHLHPHTFQGAWLFWPDEGPTT